MVIYGEKLASQRERRQQNTAMAFHNGIMQIVFRASDYADLVLTRF